jgi:hypothetical protein
MFMFLQDMARMYNIPNKLPKITKNNKNLEKFIFTISRSLSIETNIYAKVIKIKSEVSINEGGISKMCVSPREK